MTTRFYVLAIDHRSSFRRWSDSIIGEEADRDRLCRLKVVVAEALGRVADDVPGRPGLLIDEEYGEEAIARARAAKVSVIVPAEKSGQPEFEFEHGDDWADAIERREPDAVKALVRYNPEGDRARNERSRRRLSRLAQFCDTNGPPLMLELLVPPTDDPLGREEPSPEHEVSRRRLTCEAIAELRSAGCFPRWWKLEGQRDEAAFAAVAEAAGDGEATACLVLGRGADADRVSRWIVDAARAGFAGFAVGRSLWTDALARLLRREETESDAANEIASAYLGLARLFDDAAGRPTTGKMSP